MEMLTGMVLIPNLSTRIPRVDAITAATISSRAFLDAVNRAAAGLAGNADAASGATQQTK